MAKAVLYSTYIELTLDKIHKNQNDPTAQRCDLNYYDYQADFAKPLSPFGNYTSVRVMVI
jgi:hypothetical protein